MLPKRILLAFSVLACAGACGGRTVDLDPSGGSDTGSGGTASIDHSTKTVLTERLYQFWVDDTRLYWYSYLSTVKSCLKSDCGDTRVSYGTPWSMVTVGAHEVYWIPDGLQELVATCPSAGCVGAPRTFLFDPNALAATGSADGDYFYWSSAFDIYRCPSKGCGATPEVVAPGQTAELPFTFQGDYVYWQATLAQGAESNGDSGAGGEATNAGLSARIMRAPKAGSSPVQQVLAVGDGSRENPGFVTFALDSQSIYWIDPSHHILSCPSAGCGDSAPSELVSDDTVKSSLHVDAVGVYWLSPEEYPNASLHFCAFAQCADGDSVILMNKPIYQFELNGPYIYWGEDTPDTGYPATIQRMAKPSP